MKKTYEIAGEVMGFFDSFKGSRPAIDNESILIVRGKSRKVLPIDSFDSKLMEIGEILGGTEINADSDKIEEVLKSGDKHIKSNEKTTASIYSPSFDVVIAIWEDKNEIPPLYVEVTVSEH